MKKIPLKKILLITMVIGVTVTSTGCVEKIRALVPKSTVEVMEERDNKEKEKKKMESGQNQETKSESKNGEETSSNSKEPNTKQTKMFVDFELDMTEDEEEIEKKEEPEELEKLEGIGL